MEKKWFIGIDVSKSTLDVALYEQQGKSKKENDLHTVNNPVGFKELMGWMKEKGITSKACVIGMEHTGLYSMDISLFLTKKKFDYVMLTPVHLKRSLGLVRGKNDRVDALRIASYIYLHRDMLVYSQPAKESIMRLKELMAERKLYIVQASTHKAIQTDRKGRKKDPASRRREAMIQHLNKVIEQIEQEILQIILCDESLRINYTLISSVKGIGLVNAVNFIVHTCNFESFQNARQYACYTGIAPFEHSSGTSIRGKTGVSPMGARQVKADLTQAARSAVQFDGELKAYYVRKIEEGKKHGSVMNAIKFKLVSRVFAVVHRKEPFLLAKEYLLLKEKRGLDEQ